MKVIQVLTTLSFGDAVGNDTIALGAELREMGYGSHIYAENIDPRLPEGTVRPIRDLPPLEAEDVVLYHLSTGTELNYQFAEYPCRKVVIYHNITPPAFLAPYAPEKADQCQYGLNGAKYLANYVDYGLPVSDFNRRDLVAMGYTCPMDVLPILIPFEDYEKEPSRKILAKYQRLPGANILFTGRIVPNKCQEDVLAAFAAYKKYYDPDARLFLVGDWRGMERYYARLLAYQKALGVSDVIFTGHIPFDEILAYYRLADVFVCASEHEGFCVPLVEAMYFHIPIIAYNSSAIGDTLGGSGILMPEKTPALTAGMIYRVLSDAELKETILAGQQKRLQDFSHQKIRARFRACLEQFMMKGRA